MSAFQKLIHSETPVLIDFFAEWCGPCKMMPPILSEVKNELKDQVKVIKIDIDKNPELARKHSIQGVPTLLLFKEGNVEWRQSGVIPAQEILRQIRLTIQ